jgi:membrane protein DedA with SNARE-associated domain
MRELLLAAVAQYGSPALFGVVMIASLGAPLPIVLVLIVTGSLTAQGGMSLATALLAAGTGSIAGDMAGYAIGRWGGSAAIARFAHLLGGSEKMEDIQNRGRRRGGLHIFLTRWLLCPLSPFVNLVSGIAGYPWIAFLAWDTAGVFLKIVIYIWLGNRFSDRVVALDSVLGNITWGFLALFVAVYIGRALVRYKRTTDYQKRLAG